MLPVPIGLGKIRRTECKILVFIFVLTLAACDTGEGQGPTKSHRPGVADGAMTHVQFVDALRAAGMAVTVEGPVEQPFLSVKGTALSVSKPGEIDSQPIQSFQYDTPADAKADARKIGPDGAPRGTFITWLAPPHFYRRGRLLVIYNGSSEAMMAALTELLGEQFAGASG